MDLLNVLLSDDVGRMSLGVVVFSFVIIVGLGAFFLFGSGSKKEDSKDSK